MIIHDDENEVGRANVPNVEGAGSKIRLAEEEESVLQEGQSALYLANIQFTWYCGAGMLGGAWERGLEESQLLG